MNLEEMAAQLQAATKSHIITLDEIKGLIENRKISSFQNLFEDERQRDQAYKPFYMYDKKGRHTGDEKIILETPEYLVIRATKGWRDPSKEARKFYNASAGWYHSVWVVGIDDDKPWIHRLEWDQNFENDKFEWTREYILKKMHFNSSIDEIQEFEKNKIVRLQGDLTIEKTLTLEEKIRQEKSLIVSDASQKIRNDFQSKIKSDFADEINKRYAPIQADAKEARRIENLNLNERSKSDQIKLREIKKKYGITARTRTNLESKVKGRRLYDINQEIHDREALEQHHETALASHLIEVEKQFDEAFLKQEMHQINFKFGNHLIIIEKGKSRNGEILILDEKSSCFIIHDEHENRKVELSAGVYRFALLARHITDRR